jgi:DMSO/TMAO reductase YedYZ molybdopterin-dependent catalytic subunit
VGVVSVEDVRHPRRVALLAGLSGAAATIVLAALAHTLVRSLPFLPLVLAQSLVRATPGGVATFFIEHLGHWALRLAVVGTSLAFLVLGALLGLAIPPARRLPRPLAGALAFVPLWVASVASYPPAPGRLARLPFALASLPVDLAGGAVGGFAYARMLASPEPARTDESRRVLLRAMWFGAAGVLLGVADLGRLIYRRPDPGKGLLVVPNLARVTPPAADAGDSAFANVAGLTPEVTSIGDFYVVDEEIIDPDIDPATWRLGVEGLVGAPFELTYEELKAMPAVERYQTLECISNEVGGHLMSTAKWIGVPLPLILDRAGVQPGAVEVVFHAAGGYSDSLSMDQSMDPSTLIAIGMNDHVLPRAHGFPARVLSTGTYGMKNPKWLMSIEVLNRPYVGYWERRGWSKQAIVKTESRIDVPSGGADVPDSVSIAGVAFAGDRGISKVEVSTDGGSTWTAAILKSPLSSLTWRLWRYVWNPVVFKGGGNAGQAGILVRAYDGAGTLQTEQLAAPHPDGASGYDAITVRHG